TAVVSTADLSADGLSGLARDACALARATAADRYAGLPDVDDLATDQPDLALYDPAVESLDAESALRMAREAEAAALAAAPEVDNSEGAEFGGGGGQVAYASSLGFTGAYSGSSFSLSATPVARRNGSMQRDSWYTTSRRLDGLEEAASVGRAAPRPAPPPPRSPPIPPPQSP